MNKTYKFEMNEIKDNVDVTSEKVIYIIYIYIFLCFFSNKFCLESI